MVAAVLALALVVGEGIVGSAQCRVVFLANFQFTREKTRRPRPRLRLRLRLRAIERWRDDV